MTKSILKQWIYDINYPTDQYDKAKLIYDNFKFGRTPNGEIKTTEKAVFRAIETGILFGMNIRDSARKKALEELKKEKRCFVEGNHDIKDCVQSVFLSDVEKAFGDAK